MKPVSSQETAMGLPDAPAPGRPILLAWTSEAASACGAFEGVVLAYLALVSGLILIFRSNLPAAHGYILAHLLAAMGIVSLAWAAHRHESGVLRFARHWYPLPLFIYFFEELGGLVHIVFSGWFDAWLIRFDHALTGVHPSLWLAQFSSPPLNDFMQFCYMTYFLDLVVIPAALYVAREERPFWTVMTSLAVAHCSVYVIALLFPVESPHFALAAMNPAELRGGASTALINLIERYGRVHGAAFPSAHVAGATAAILGAWKYRRRLCWACLPFFLGMMVSTVYGRYHYVADVLAGLLTGAIAFCAAQRLMAVHSSQLQCVSTKLRAQRPITG